jgi:hypothetical protein
MAAADYGDPASCAEIRRKGIRAQHRRVQKNGELACAEASNDKDHRAAQNDYEAKQLPATRGLLPIAYASPQINRPTEKHKKRDQLAEIEPEHTRHGFGSLRSLRNLIWKRFDGWMSVWSVSENRGKMMAHAIPRIRFSPDGRRPLAEQSGENATVGERGKPGNYSGRPDAIILPPCRPFKQLIRCPDMIRQAAPHSRAALVAHVFGPRLVWTRKVVEREEQRQRCFVVLPLLAESVRQARQPTNRHADR